MKKRLISMLLALVVTLGLLPTAAFAASSEEEALGEVHIYNGEMELSYLSINGRIRTLIYTYYNYQDSTGRTRELPAYCVNPNITGVPQTVAPGESIEYLADEKASDPKIMGIVANGYPTRGLGELKLENKYLAYYATKMALWCYILPNWDISNLKVNPNLTGVELQRAQSVLTAAKDIYARGTTWNEILAPEIICTHDRDNAYPVTIDGKAYKQQVFTFWSKTWVCDYAVSVAFTDPASVPAGTRIVDMNNKDISTLSTSATGDGYASKFKILYPADAVEGKTGSAQLSFRTDVYKYAIFYAVCAEKGKYGELQNYMVDTDPTLSMQLSAYSNYSDDPTDTPDTGLLIRKLETGTDLPLSGALFEVVGPDGATVGTFSSNGSGEILLPLTLSGNYTVIERQPPANHLMGDNTIQNVNVEYGKTATVTFYNAPYGALTVEKRSNTGMSLPGAVITIQHIESGKTYTAETNYSGRAIFTEILPGAYRIQETTAPSGWKLDDTVYTATVVSGETTSVPIINQELPGLRIIKYDRKNYEAMPNVTFEVFRDTVSLGKFRTDEFGEILLTNVTPGTYRAVEVDTGSDGHILDTTPQEVELTAGDGIKELLFFNDVKPGLRLVKVDSIDPSKVIPNAVFEIKSVAGDYGPQEFTTDRNGEIDLSKLPTGAYVVTEKSCPGYVIDQAQRIIQLDPNEDAQFVFTNSVKPSLQLIKTSADGSRLAGITFRISRIADGSHYLDRTTNAQGEILIADLEPGVYSVKETATVADHLIDPKEHHVELFPGQTSTIVLQNDKRPNLTIHKNDADDGSPVEGCVFIVKAADGSTVTEIKTGADGTATVENLLPIVYEVTEKSVPTPYLLDAPSQIITLHPNQDSGIYFENHKAPTIEIIKENSITHERLSNVRFQVWYASNQTSTGELNDLGVFTTDKNGRIELTGPDNGLKDGWFRVRELEPPTGFSIKDSDTQEAFVAAGKGHTFRFENTPLSALVVWKYDSVTGEAVSNCRFQLRYLGGETSGSGGTVIGTYMTAQNGSFTVTGLQAGYYICEELASDSGHVIDTAPQSVYISGKDQDVVQLHFGNSPKGSLLVKKVSSADQSPLSDVEFFVTDSTGAVVGDANGKFVTDSVGSFLVEGIAPGTTLVVKETRAKPGYLLDDTPQTAVIRAGQTVTLEFRNQPEGNLVINKLSSADKKTPLAGVQFKITYANGQVVDAAGGQLSSNGLYTTDKNGQIILSGITGTVIVTEVASIPGYLIDESTRTQTVAVNPNDTQTLNFYNTPTKSLVIQKYIEGSKNEGLAGVTFLVTDSSGAYIGPNNGQYVTDSQGRIVLTGIVPGTTVTAKEIKSVDGFVLDSTPQSILIKEDAEGQKLVFYNKRAGGLELIKVAENDRGVRIPNTEFEIRKMDGGLVGTFTTDKRGRFYAPLDAGDYYLVETRAGDGYRLDEAPIYFTVKDNATTTKTVTNKAFTGILIHKVDSVSGDGIPDVSFLVYDGKMNPIDQVTTDQDGWAYVNDLGIEGRVYLRELEAEGYVVDTALKTVYVRPGETAEIEWENTPITGQIQIYKYAAEYNSITGTAPGAPLQGAVYEISSARSGKVVDYITTDARGVAASKPLPLGRYKIVEVTAPAYWQLDATVFDETLEYPGQIIKLSAYDKPAALGVSITKRGNAEVLAGSQMRYDITVANTSNVALESFFWHDKIPYDVARATVLSTGTYSARLNYRVLYKTNFTSSYQVLASNLLTSNNYSFALNAIPMQAGEVVTDIYFDFGKVTVGFQSVTGPTLSVMVNGTAVSGYQMINRADVGGKYQGTWQTAQANWVTIIRKYGPTPTLPKTGY